LKRWASVLAVSTLLAVACGRGPGATVQHAGPREGGILTVALDSDIRYADPALVSDDSSLYVANQVVEGLVGLAPGTITDVVPVLASAMPTVSSDGLTYTFKLRSGIKFHDGTDFNAAAVKFNYDRWNAFPKGPLQNDAYYFAAAFGGFGASSNLAKVDAPDPSTVVLHLRRAQSDFLISQAVSAFGIQSPTAIQKNDGNNADLTRNPYARGANGQGNAMVGTGPFMFNDWVAGDHIALVKNPNYWNAQSEPFLAQIIFKVFATSAAKLAALQSGSVDLVETLDPAAVETVETAEAGSSTAVAGASSVVLLDRGNGCDLTQLAMNDSNLFSSSGVRLAVASAVNRSSYIGGFYAGEASVADSWLPAGAMYYKREYLPTQNVTGAMGDLAQAGVSGSGLTVDLWYPTGAPALIFPDAQGLAQAVALDLRAVGFTVNLKSEAYSPNYLADQAAGKLPLWLQSQSCNWASPDDFLYRSFHYVNGAPSQMFNYKNDALNAVMTGAVSDTTTAKAKADWEKAQDLIRADLPTVPLLDAKLPAASRSYVMGFVAAGNRVEILSTVWLDK
jgi:peptide/nickel transport system substrate-binding protein